MPTRLTSLALVALAGCGGEEQLTSRAPALAPARLIYLWGEGIEACGPAPVASGLALLLTPAKVDEAQGSLAAERAELTITDADGSPVPLVPENEGFRARFPRAGTYVATAAFEDGTTLARQVAVAEQAGVSLGRRGRQVVTHGTGRDCTQSVGEGATPTLALNQELHAWLLPTDASGQPLLGELDLEFAGAMRALAEPPGFLNRYRLEPSTPGTNTLSITDLRLRQVHELSFEVDDALAACPLEQ